MTYDAVVVGAGMAGMSAAVRLAEGGLRVLVVAKGNGSTHLAPAVIDILGYAPERVESPASALPAFAKANPGHPYALVSVEDVAESVAWLKEHLSGPRYVGGLESNYLLPTAVGVPRPSAVVPETMASGDLRAGGRFLICGFGQLKDFYPALVADNLRAASEARRPIEAGSVVLDSRAGDEADVGALAFARSFDDPEFRKAVIAEVARLLDGEGAVGFPAVLGLNAASTAWAELQDGLGRPVFEIPTLPPSVPGIRLFSALHGRLREAGGRLVLGVRAVGAVSSRGKLDAVIVRTAARDVRFGARWFVLATGGFGSGGIEMDSRGEVGETVFGLPISGGPPVGEPMFSPMYLDRHPLARAGVRTDDTLRPIRADGEVIYGNLYAVGATLAGAEPWREKSGEGISLATASRAARTILRRRGRTARPPRKDR